MAQLATLLNEISDLVSMQIALKPQLNEIREPKEHLKKDIETSSNSTKIII